MLKLADLEKLTDKVKHWQVAQEEMKLGAGDQKKSPSNVVHVFKAFLRLIHRVCLSGMASQLNLTQLFSACPSVFRLKQQIPRLQLALQLASAGSSQLPKSARKTDPSGTLRFLSHRGIGCIARQRLADSYFAQQH